MKSFIYFVTRLRVCAHVHIRSYLFLLRLGLRICFSLSTAVPWSFIPLCNLIYQAVGICKLGKEPFSPLHYLALGVTL